MTLAEVERFLGKIATPYDDDRLAATVRAADKLLGRCEEMFERHTRVSGEDHSGIIADIRKIRGGGGQ